MMKKKEALDTIRREWLALPPSKRSTQEQAYLFTLGAEKRYEFVTRATKYQVIMGMLSGEIGKP